MSDQFNQFRVFVEKTLSSQSNQPVAKCAGSHDDLSILPEEVRLRDEEISAELRSRREKNAKLEEEVKRLTEELRVKEAIIQVCEEERLMTVQ